MGARLEQLVLATSALTTEVSLERVLERVVEVAAQGCWLQTGGCSRASPPMA